MTISEISSISGESNCDDTLILVFSRKRMKDKFIHRFMVVRLRIEKRLCVVNLIFVMWQQRRILLTPGKGTFLLIYVIFIMFKK